MIKDNEEQYIIEEKLNELLLKYNARIDLYTSNGVIIYSSESAPKMMVVDKNAFLMEIIQSKKAISTFQAK